MSPLFCRHATKTRLAFAVLAALQVASCSSREERAQSYYENGMKLLTAHENQKAAIEFRNAVRLKNDLLPAWRGLGQAQEASHHLEGLVTVLRTILELEPNDETTRVKLGKLLVAAGAVDEALKVLNEAGEIGSNDANLHALKAIISYKRKNSAEAIREAQAALKIAPGNTDALMVLAADRLANNDPQGALKLFPDAGDQLTDLGIQLFEIKAYEQLKDYPSIELVLRRLSERYPQEVSFRKQLVRFFVSQNRPQDAENELRAIVATHPNSVEAGLDLIRFLQTTRGPLAAREALLTRINGGGEIFPYQLALAELDYDQGNVKDSFELLQHLGQGASAENAVAAKIKLADLNLRQKKLDVADNIVADILAKDSRNVDALRLRALIHLDRQQLDAAISDLREALNDQPRAIELMLMLAAAYERSGSIDLADKQLADATKASNFDPKVGLSYVTFLRRRARADRAYDVVTELANRWPNNAQVLSALAEAKLTRQDWVGAEETAERIRRLDNSRGIADEILGVALNGQHKSDASITAFQNAVDATPLAAQPMVDFVQALVRAHRAEKATAFLQGVLKDHPHNAEAYVLLGSLALTNRSLEQAEKSFKAAIESEPKNPVGYQALAEYYSNQGKLSAAFDTVQTGLKEDPDNLSLHFALAGLLDRKGDFEAAISECEYLLKQQPGSMIVANNLASLLANHRDDKASLDRARLLAATLRDSQVQQFKDTLGWVYYREGDFKAAIPLLQEAALGLPNLPVVHYHLAMSLIGTGQFTKAAEQLRVALGSSPDNELRAKINTELNNIAAQ
jgi:tetratricopeptide (TPR) repeat protein